MNRTPDLRCMGFDGYGATRETRGTSQNVNGPGDAQTSPGQTGSPMEAPDVPGRYARTPGQVNG